MYIFEEAQTMEQKRQDIDVGKIHYNTTMGVNAVSTELSLLRNENQRQIDQTRINSILDSIEKCFDEAILQEAVTELRNRALSKAELLAELKIKIIRLAKKDISEFTTEQQGTFKELIISYIQLFRVLKEDACQAEDKERASLSNKTFSDIADHFIQEASKTLANPIRSPEEILKSAQKLDEKIYKVAPRRVAQAICIAVGALLGIAAGVTLGAAIGGLVGGGLAGMVVGGIIGYAIGLVAGGYLGYLFYERYYTEPAREACKSRLLGREPDKTCATLFYNYLFAEPAPVGGPQLSAKEPYKTVEALSKSFLNWGQQHNPKSAKKITEWSAHSSYYVALDKYNQLIAKP
jgi:hypothetical protein